MPSRITDTIYQRSLHHFWTWARLAHGHEEHYPVPPEDVADFLLAHIRPEPELDRRLVDAGVKRDLGPMALGTLKIRLAALDNAHRDRQLEPPSKSPLVQLHIDRHAAARRRASSPAKPRTKHPITDEILERLLATCDLGRLLGRRDHALLSLGHAVGGSAVGSQLVRLEIEDLEKNPESNTYRWTSADVSLSGPVAQSLRRWLRELEARGLDRGLVFRGLTPKGEVGPEIRPMTPAGVTKIIQRRAEMAGLEGRLYGSSSFSSHEKASKGET